VFFAWAVAAAGVLLAPSGRASDERDRAWDVPSVFFVAKSENRNQVHYGIRLDDGCAPVGDAPVYAYWRMLERGPTAVEPLLSREVRAYGIAEQHVIERGPGVSRTSVRLEALGSRPLVIESYASGGRCVARAVLPLAGVPAVLGDVFVQLRWPFGVAHLLLSGHALEGGTVLSEQVEP
jgi:hypothetical protein